MTVADEVDPEARGPQPISVVIVEDHIGVAESLEVALDGADGVEVLDTAHDLASGLSVIALRRPRVVVMDAVLPDGDGAASTPAVQELSPDTAVVVLSGSQYMSAAVRAVRTGAAGYVSKAERLDRILAAIRTAAAGGTSFTTEQLQAAMTVDGAADGFGLTEREAEVLQHLADGRSTEEITDLLDLSVHTVRNHIGNLTAKLGVGSRVAAVATAHRQGLVSPPKRD